MISMKKHKNSPAIWRHLSCQNRGSRFSLIVDLQTATVALGNLKTNWCSDALSNFSFMAQKFALNRPSGGLKFKKNETCKLVMEFATVAICCNLIWDDFYFIDCPYCPSDQLFWGGNVCPSFCHMNTSIPALAIFYSPKP